MFLCHMLISIIIDSQPFCIKIKYLCNSHLRTEAYRGMVTVSTVMFSLGYKNVRLAVISNNIIFEIVGTRMLGIRILSEC